MRIALALGAILLAACSADTDAGDNNVSLTVNTEAVESGAEAALNEAQEIGGAIVNDVQEEGAKVQNGVGDVDVDVDVDRNAGGNSN